MTITKNSHLNRYGRVTELGNGVITCVRVHNTDIYVYIRGDQVMIRKDMDVKFNDNIYSMNDEEIVDRLFNEVTNYYNMNIAITLNDYIRQIFYTD